MCGIAGIVNKNINFEDLTSLKQALEHRGPDSSGIWVSPDHRCGLVHCRLAIIDTSAASCQPFHSSDGQFTIVFNGEIFNFIEIRKELIGLGSSFRTTSDTEVLIEAWRHWQTGMLCRLNGMWALAIRDNNTGDIFLARDRFGIKPLLYCALDGRFAFASELRALRVLKWIPKDIDYDVARQFLVQPFTIEGSERTLIKAVRRLPAGHYAIYKNDSLQIKRWWRTLEHLPQIQIQKTARANQFLELFKDSIRIRLRSDVPVGTCLSGGFDSSAITCLISELKNDDKFDAQSCTHNRMAFIASFPNADNDETSDAVLVAKYAKVDSQIVEITNDTALANIEDVLQDLDDVYISLPTAAWLIYKSVRHAGLSVTIDGHGADELMGAYRRENYSLKFKLKLIFDVWIQGAPRLANYFYLAKYLFLRTKKMCFIKELDGLNFNYIQTPFADDTLPSHWGMVNRSLYHMFHSTVLPTILRNFDRLSMAHGVEVRMPFMDWRLVTFVMALPDSDKLDPDYTKAIAREAMKSHMPEEIRTNKRKVGFNSPMPNWLNGPLQGWVINLLNNPNAEYELIVDLPKLRICVDRLNSSKTWDWSSVGYLWPYIHLKWFMDRLVTSCQAEV